MHAMWLMVLCLHVSAGRAGPPVSLRAGVSAVVPLPPHSGATNVRQALAHAVSPRHAGLLAIISRQQGTWKAAAGRIDTLPPNLTSAKRGWMPVRVTLPLAGAVWKVRKIGWRERSALLTAAGLMLVGNRINHEKFALKTGSWASRDGAHMPVIGRSDKLQHFLFYGALAGVDIRTSIYTAFLNEIKDAYFDWRDFGSLGGDDFDLKDLTASLLGVVSVYGLKVLSRKLSKLRDRPSR